MARKKDTLNKIILPTYTLALNIRVKILIIDSLSSYNIIIGRPSVHDMKVALSTLYEQTIKFPTKWGLQEIKTN